MPSHEDYNEGHILEMLCCSKALMQPTRSHALHMHAVYMRASGKPLTSSNERGQQRVQRGNEPGQALLCVHQRSIRTAADLSQHAVHQAALAAGTTLAACWIGLVTCWTVIQFGVTAEKGKLSLLIQRALGSTSLLRQSAL